MNEALLAGENAVGDAYYPGLTPPYGVGEMNGGALPPQFRWTHAAENVRHNTERHLESSTNKSCITTANPQSYHPMHGGKSFKGFDPEASAAALASYVPGQYIGGPTTGAVVDPLTTIQDRTSCYPDLDSPILPGIYGGNDNEDLAADNPSSEQSLAASPKLTTRTASVSMSSTIPEDSGGSSDGAGAGARTSSGSATTPTSTTSTATSDIKKHRERNRVAARKCRQKAKRNISRLQRHERELSRHNKALHGHVSCLRDEVLDLKNEILRHGECGSDAIDNYIENAARRQM